jgi:D-aminopeptidase
VGVIGQNSSGDLFLAFATGNHIPSSAQTSYELKMLLHHHVNVFFEAVAECVKEAILNAVTSAETMVGYKGHTAHALPLDKLRRVMKKYGRV